MRTHQVFPNEFPEPWASDWGEDEYGIWMGFTYKGVKQLFRWIEPGEFSMGSPTDEPERYDIEIQHTVSLTQGYWLAESTVTQALWQAVMNDNPSNFNGENHPVERVSWNDAQRFIETMNNMKPALKLCLPSEAQWEYACRAGTNTAFSFGIQINSTQVNFDGNYPYNDGERSQYREETVDVKFLPANPWGLYEMHGNVLEWCQDWYGPYSSEAVIDPKGPETGDNRVLRGGSWIYDGGYCRSANRSRRSPGRGRNDIGFRLARGH